MLNSLGSALNTTLAGVAPTETPAVKTGDEQLACYMVNNLARNTEEQCKFILDNDCLEEEATLDYVYLVFCQIDYELRPMAISLVVFLVVVLFLNLSAVADEFLCPSLLTVAKNLRMSDSLAVSRRAREAPEARLPNQSTNQRHSLAPPNLRASLCWPSATAVRTFSPRSPLPLAAGPS